VYNFFENGIKNVFVEKTISRQSGGNLINFLPSSLLMRPNKLECLYMAITFQSNLTFGGNTMSLPKKEASGRCSNWAGSGLALKF
jgi:hypothetical protein